jgi:hypothetical protein
MQYLGLIKYPQTLAKQNEKQNQSMKHKFAVVGKTIAFSTCNQPFKPLSIPRE